MKRIVASFALLLFMHTATIAKAEELEQNLAKNDKAERVKNLLINLGLANKDLKKITQFAADKIDGDFAYFSRNKLDISGNKFEFGLRHNLEGASFDNLQLYLQPENSSYVYTFSHEAVMVSYHADF